MSYALAYHEWSEAEHRAVQTVFETTVPHEELFIRKLVNATIIRNRLFEHSSNESENFAAHHIYLKPFEDWNQPFGPAIREAAFEYCSISLELEPDFRLYDGTKFVQFRLRSPTEAPLHIAQLLLDHYLVVDGRTYETVYSALDHERKKVVFYLSEVNL